MSRCASHVALRLVAGATLAGTVLTGCSDIYYDRRETISSGAGDAVAANIAVQTVDPWPRNVGNQNISMNGDRAALAAQRYRTGRVLPPWGSGTSSAGYQQQSPQQQQQMQQPANASAASGGMQVR